MKRFRFPLLVVFCLVSLALLPRHPSGSWLSPQVAFAQEKSNTFYVGQFAGPDVGTKLTNAQASCSSNTSIPCVIVIDAILAVWPQGTPPSRCAQCIWIDYRAVTFNATPLTISPGGSFLAGDGTAGAPAYSFSSHSNTGFYKRSALDEIPFSSNGINILDLIANGIRVKSTTGYLFSSGDPTAAPEDTGISRTGPAAVAVGNGSVGDATGTLNLATLNSSANILAKRLKASNGTALVTGDFSVSAGSFGTTASFSAVTGTDQGWTVSIASAGTGQTANPAARLTFHDGTWTNSPIVVCNRQENNAPSGLMISSSTATLVDMTFAGTPVAGTTYTINCIAMGR